MNTARQAEVRMIKRDIDGLNRIIENAQEAIRDLNANANPGEGHYTERTRLENKIRAASSMIEEYELQLRFIQ